LGTATGEYMITTGRSGKDGRGLARTLMNARDNERVELVEVYGLFGVTVTEMLLEMRLVAAGTRGENYYYHATINPDPKEPPLTPGQWEFAVDRLQENLGLTNNARFVVEHEKAGRIYRHAVWNRVNWDTMKFTPDNFSYRAHDKTCCELEEAFGHQPTDRRRKRRPGQIEAWEQHRAWDNGLTPAVIEEDITALWQATTTGQGFAAALEQSGYIICKGDRAQFCIVDIAGDVHSLARRISGATIADLRTRLSDIDRDRLPTVKQAAELVRQGVA
jgi:relaxase-like protein